MRKEVIEQIIDTFGFTMALVIIEAGMKKCVSSGAISSFQIHADRENNSIDVHVCYPEPISYVKIDVNVSDYEQRLVSLDIELSAKPVFNMPGPSTLQ